MTKSPDSPPVLTDQDAARIDQHHATVEEAYDAYDDLRPRCPIAHSERNGGYYMLLRHADVRAAALDWKTFSSARGVTLPLDPTRPPLPAIEMDGAEHMEWRKRYTDAITPATLAAIEPKVERIANHLIDQFAAQGRCDLVHSFAEPLPVLTICEAIGLDRDPDEVRQLAIMLTVNNTDPDAHAQAMGELGKFILGEIHARRETPRDDYLTTISRMESDGRLLNDYELTAYMIGFLVAGHETTAAALSGLLYHSLLDPGAATRLLADEERLSRAVEEAVRLTSPFHGFSRTTTQDAMIDGKAIPADQVVRLCWASANRDPSVFPDPDRFDVDRERNPHLGFGAGRHVCAGAPLARAEMRIAMRTLLKRLPDIELVSNRLEWEFVGGMMTMPKSLEARFTPIG
jgi:cytochrome P450